MKRKISVLAINCIILFVCFSLFVPVTHSNLISNNCISFANTHFVGGSGEGNFSTIQDAIDYASSGDSIFVYPGTYYERLIIEKSLNLIGTHHTNTIIHGSNTGDDPCVDVRGDDLFVSNFSIVWADWEFHEPGFRIYGKNTQIKNCNISHHDKGIVIMPSSEYCSIENTFFYNIHEGMWLWPLGTQNHAIKNNSFSHCDYGMKVTNSHYNIIQNNSFQKNVIGILFENADENIISQNSFIENALGMDIDDHCQENVFFNNNFIENFNHVQANGVNYWDNGNLIGGNYWDDYTGMDYNGDGFGDQPYIINGDENKDNYPLMMKDQWIRPDLDVTVIIPEFGFIHNEMQFEVTATGGLPEYTYYWDFGDDHASNIQNPTHSYEEPGLYNVICTVTDATNTSKQVSKNIQIYVTDENPPEITIISPNYGFYFFNRCIFEFNIPICILMGPLTIEIAAEDAETKITELNIYMKNVISESIDLPYYSFEWESSKPGKYELNVEAVDIAGNSAETSVKMFKIL